MDYLTPRRGAVSLLNLFSAEPDFAEVLGDLSEEFQQHASAGGHAAATRWYRREALRNARAFVSRELWRTPVKVLAVSLLTFMSGFFFPVAARPILEEIKWAWVPTAHWRLFETVFPFICSLIFVGLGALSSLILKAREFALAVSYATLCTLDAAWVLSMLRYSAAKDRLPRNMSLPRLTEIELTGWAAGILLYSLGCLWIRKRRLAPLSSAVGPL